MAECATFCKESDVRIAEAAAELARWQNMIPIDQMTVQEFQDEFPDQVRIVLLKKYCVCNNCIFIRFGVKISPLSILTHPNIKSDTFPKVKKKKLNNFRSLVLIYKCI